MVDRYTATATNENDNLDIPELPVEDSQANDRYTLIYDDDVNINIPGDKSFIDGVVSDFFKRSNEVQKSREMFASGEITLPEHAFQSAAKGSMLAFDVVGGAIVKTLGTVWDGIEMAEDGLRMIIPDEMEESIDGWSQDQAKKLTHWWKNSQAAQDGVAAAIKGVKDYGIWKEENPRAAMNLESIVDVALFWLPYGKVNPWKGKNTSVFEKPAASMLTIAEKQGGRQRYDQIWAQLNYKNSINEQNIARVTNEGNLVPAFPKVQTINYNQYEKELMDLLIANGFKGRKSPTANNELINHSIERYSKQLLGDLKKIPAMKKPIPWNQTQANLSSKLDDLIENSPIYKNNPAMQKVIKENLNRINKILADEKFAGTPLGVFRLRQAFDEFVRTNKGAGKLDGTGLYNAMDDSVRVIRTELNNIVAVNAEGTAVKDLLRKQELLYKARGMILPAVQADSKKAIQRVWKNLSNAIGLKMDYNRTMAVAFGASAYGIAGQSLGYTAMAAVGIAGGGYMAGVAVQTRITKIALGKTLALMDKAMKTPGANPEIVKALSIDRAAIKELFNRPIEKANAEQDEAAVAIDRTGG